MKKVYAPGLGAEVARGLGADPVPVGPEGVESSLADGSIEIAEWGAFLPSLAADIPLLAKHAVGTGFTPAGTALALSYVACRAIVGSRAGRVIRAIRDAESRTRFLGYRVESYKLWFFVFSAVVAGIAGALYVPQVGIINPSEFEPINSIEVVIWVAVGGRGTLYGAAAGAILVNYAKTYFTAALPDIWLYALGAIFIGVTLFLPKGLMGLLPAPGTSR